MGLVHPRVVRSRSLTMLGIAAFVALAIMAWLGLSVSPPDAVQGDAARLLYVHVASAWLAYLAYAVTALCSLLYLWPRTRARRFDLLAGASAELGVLFSALTLVLGSMWGKPVWGAWWVWDARVVTTAVLFFLYLGYLALRRVPEVFEVRAKRSAIAALIAFVDVPIVHFSVNWWRTLHQDGTVYNRTMHVEIHGSMAFTLIWSVFAFTLAFGYLVMRRFDLALIEDRVEALRIDRAVRERRAEADLVMASSTPPSGSGS